MHVKRKVAGAETRAGRRDRRLARADWLDAGQAILSENGLAGLRLAALTRLLNVSSGSFYHHFRDMDDYLGALAEHYSTARIQRLLQDIASEIEDPLERMRVLGRRSWRSDLGRLDAAMRVWAASEPRAAAAIGQSEQVVVDFLSDSFRRVGFTESDALMRAWLFTSLQAAKPLSLSEVEMAKLRSQVFELLAHPGGRGG